MANLSESVNNVDSGASEGHQENSLDSKPTTTKPLYSIVEIVRFAQIALYCLGFVSNLPILVVFFKQGLRNSSTNTGFFTLALADLSVCVVYITDLTAQSVLDMWSFRELGFWRLILFKQAVREMSAWTTAVMCWERLCSIILPERVGFKTVNMNHRNCFPSSKSIHQE